MNRVPSSIHRRLVFVVFASVLPAALLVAALLATEYLQEREGLESSTRATARAMATALDQRLATSQAALQALATSPLLSSGDIAGFHAQAQLVQEQQGLAAVGLVDADGQAMLNTLQPVGAPLRPPGTLPFLEPVFAQRRSVATDLFPSSIHGAPALAVAIPVVQGDRVTHALVGGFAPESIREQLLKQRLPEGWTAAVVDRTGTLVARTAEHERFVGARVGELLRAAMQGGPEGSLDSRSLAGVPVLTTFSRAPVSGWWVTIAIPRAQLTAELRKNLALLVLGTAAVLGASLAFALYLGRSVGSTVRQLEAQASRLGRGEPVEPLRTRFSETDALAATLHQASVDLRRAGEELSAHEAELALSHSRLAGLVESAMDGIVSIDVQQRVVLFNRAAEAMFGRPRHEVIGQPITVLMPAVYREGHAARVQAFSERGGNSLRTGLQGIIKGVRPDGTVFPLEASISQVDTPDGKLFTAVVRDVSARVRAAEEMAAFSATASALREQDKKRIARELHDDIAQTLAVLKLDANWLMAQPGLGEEARGKLARMATLLGDGMVAIRRIAADMRPLVLDELGLGAALESLADAFEERTGVRCEAAFDAGLDLEDPHATEIYRLVQEGLANVAKHAKATRMQLRLERTGDGVRLLMQDDGVGFDVEQPRKAGSFGLTGLRERVHLLKGTVEVASRPGAGTRIEIVLPLPQAAPAAVA